MPECACINDLPHEIIATILSYYISSFVDITLASLCCRKWRNIVMEHVIEMKEVLVTLYKDNRAYHLVTSFDRITDFNFFDSKNMKKRLKIERNYICRMKRLYRREKIWLWMENISRIKKKKAMKKIPIYLYDFGWDENIFDRPSQYRRQIARITI